MCTALAFARLSLAAACSLQSGACDVEDNALLQYENNPRLNILVSESDAARTERCLQGYIGKVLPLNMLHEYKPWKLRDGLPTSSRNLVISAGMGTTGTHGVMTALESLGMHGYHWRDSRASANEHANKSKLPDFVVPLLDKLGSNVSFNECYKAVESFDFSQLPSNVDYVSDSPFTEMFLDLYMQFPGAKVVLTTRPSLEWAKRRKKVHKFTPVPVLRPCGQSWMLEHYTDQTLAAMLDAYHDLVRCVVPPDNLLEIDLFNGDANLTLALSNFLKAAK